MEFSSSQAISTVVTWSCRPIVRSFNILAVMCWPTCFHFRSRSVGLLYPMTADVSTADRGRRGAGCRRREGTRCRSLKSDERGRSRRVSRSDVDSCDGRRCRVVWRWKTTPVISDTVIRDDERWRHGQREHHQHHRCWCRRRRYQRLYDWR